MHRYFNAPTASLSLVIFLCCPLIVLSEATNQSTSFQSRPSATARNRLNLDQGTAKLTWSTIHTEERRSKSPHAPRQARLRKYRPEMERHARETNVQEKSERVAVLVAGSFNRYFLVSSAERLVAPLRKQGYIVDYFLSLTTEAAKPYRAELGYTQYATWDPVFSNGARTEIPNNTAIAATVQDILVVRAGARLRHFSLLGHLDVEEDPRIRKRHRRATKQHPGEDVDLRFPTLNLSYGARNSANVVANRNIIRVFVSERLWAALLDAERADGEPFDLVLFLRDDTKWLADFDLDRLRAQGSADVYLLSCDVRVPRLSPDEINDHGLVVRRKAAGVFGLYLTRLLESDIEGCKRRMHKPL